MLQQYMRELVAERRDAAVKEELHDLFSSLLDANEVEEGADKLSDRALLGNIFIFLVAGPPFPRLSRSARADVAVCPRI